MKIKHNAFASSSLSVSTGIWCLGVVRWCSTLLDVVGCYVVVLLGVLAVDECDGCCWMLLSVVGCCRW